MVSLQSLKTRKTSVLVFLPIIFLFFIPFLQAQTNSHKVDELILKLEELVSDQENPLLKRHFQSILSITLDTTHGIKMSETDLENAAGTLDFLTGEGKDWSTYLKNPRPLIMAFKSPMDGKSTYYWLFLPKNFDPKQKTIPFYMELHGSGGGSNNSPWKMLYHYLQPEVAPGTAQMYKREGYMIYPWGRGDKGYDGIAFIDIKECLEDFDSMFLTDPERQFLYGFSMGGKGAYKLALEYPQRWTALGIYSGIMESTLEEVEKIKHLPVWMTWGEKEKWVDNNRVLRDHFASLKADVTWNEQKGVGHAYKADFQENLMKWFLSHPK